MKNIIIIFFLFLCYNVVAQQRFPVGVPTQFSTGFFKQGYHQSDSGTIIANRDTNWLAKYSGTIVFKPSNKQFYWFDSTTLTWNQFGSTIDTTSLSNRIDLKLNISDTADMLLPYLRKIDTTNKWVQDVYVRNDSLFKFKNGTETFLDTLGGGGGGPGTVTSVALSMPSAFSVSGSPITTSGTFNISGAGTALQYIRGNGTLATTDTGMIPDFYLKVRGLLSGTSPITFNTTTGAIAINNANTSGTKGAATFSNSDFSDNGSGTISLSALVAAGSCTGCVLNIDAKGRITGYSDGAGGATNNTNIGSGFRPVNEGTQEMRTYFAGFGQRLDSVANANGLTWSADTARATGLPTYFYVDSLHAVITADNGLTKTGDNIQLGGALIEPTTITSAAGANRIVYNGVSAFGDGPQLEITTSGSAGIAVSGGTTDGRGVFGVATTGVGIYGTATGLGGYGVFGSSSLGNAYYARSDSGMLFEGALVPISNNTVITARSTSRASQSAGANGIGYSDDSYLQTTVASRPSHQFVYKLSNATDASYASEFEFYQANAGSMGRKYLISGDGQWTWDGYPALTPQTDTANVKPIGYNTTTGLIEPMANWVGSGGGSIPSWQQTLNVSRQSSSGLIFDTTMVGNPVEKLWHKYEKLVKTDTATTAFYDWQFAGSNNGSFNEVRMFGWNLNAGGGQQEAGKPALGESWESNYQINPAYPSASDRLVEKHEIYVTPGGTQHRIGSYTINTNTGTISLYHTIGSFSLHNVGTHTPYFSVLGTSNNTQQTFINSSNQSSYFSTNVNFNQDASTAAFTLSAGASGRPVNLYNLSGFTQAALPNTVYSRDGYDGTQIQFNGATTGALARWVSDSSQTMISTFTNVAMRFMPNTAQALDLRSTRVNIYQPTGIGTGVSTPIAQLDVRNSALNQTIYCENTKAAGKAGIFTTVNAGGSNTGLSVNASGGTDNKGINFEASMGAGDWNIYSSNASKTYLAGKVQLGTTSDQARKLYVNGSIGANKDSITIITSIGTSYLLAQDTAAGSDLGRFKRILPSNLGFATGNTLYTGDDTISSNRNVNVNNLNLTFSDVNTFRMNMDVFALSRADGTFPFSSVVIAPAQQLRTGYTPTAGTFSKGAAVSIDTNNNVSLGTGFITSTHPLYTFGSAFAQGFTSARGNFYRVDSISADATATIEQYYFVIDASSGNVTITLPAASTSFGNGVGVVYKFYRIDNTLANTVTIAASGTDTINGAASQTLTAQYEEHSMQCISATGGKWAYN